jgi:hypothetical protein
VYLAKQGAQLLAALERTAVAGHCDHGWLGRTGPLRLTGTAAAILVLVVVLGRRLFLSLVLVFALLRRWGSRRGRCRRSDRLGPCLALCGRLARHSLGHCPRQTQ